jgi:putative aldouronate transport system permease protein
MIGKSERFQQAMRRWWPFYIMLAPGLLYFFVYHYLPIWEARIAFQDVRIIPPNIWVGTKHFVALASSPVFLQVLMNTIIISAMKLVFIFPGVMPESW